MKDNDKKPCFTKRHYCILAGFIKEYEDECDTVPDKFFTKLCILFKEDNPAFKLERFVKYSGKI